MSGFNRTDDELAAAPLTFRDGLFAGQVALVSGAGRGLGKAIAFQLARLGAKLALCGRNEARLEATAETLRSRRPCRPLPRAAASRSRTTRSTSRPSSARTDFQDRGLTGLLLR